MDQPIRIAVMGPTGSGKTTFVNLASRSNLQVGSSLRSSTPEVQLANEFTLDGRRVVLIDTPGFDDTTKTDTDILKKIATFLATSYENGSRLAGLIYMHRISDRRFSGIAGKNFKIFRDLCGEKSLKNVILVTNMWGGVSAEVGEARERELSSDFLKPALDKGAQMVRHPNTQQSTHDIIRRIMKNHPVVLQIQHELVDERKDVVNTSAGKAINAELEETKRRHEAEVKKAQEEIARGLREKEEEARRKMEEESKRREEEMRRVREERERIELQRRQELEQAEQEARRFEERVRAERERTELRYRQELERAEQEARRLEEQARVERERAEEEHRRQVAMLNDRLAAEEERRRQAAVLDGHIAAVAGAAEAARQGMEQGFNHIHHQVRQHTNGDCMIM